MNWFSEKFMEDCIAEAPAAFIKRRLKLHTQQRRIGGFVPDLILKDEDNRTVIIEIQKNALDRHHLYRCLEYRDILSEKEGELPEIILVCENIADRFVKITDTHKISVCVLNREEFVSIAVQHCPASLRSHLLGSYVPQKPTLSPNKFRAFGWYEYEELADIYAFTVSELARTGLDKKMRDYAQRIIWNAKQVLDGPHELELVLDPRHWRIDNLVEKPLGWVPPSQTGFTRIRKPRAKLDLFVTSKGNLSVRWYPDIESWERNVPFDWIEALLLLSHMPISDRRTNFYS